MAAPDAGPRRRDRAETHLVSADAHDGIEVLTRNKPKNGSTALAAAVPPEGNFTCGFEYRRRPGPPNERRWGGADARGARVQ
jgi:hypothetical protein